jgi:simple sugar transport system ATP-binding protein
VILITHKLDELLGVADRCTVLRRGRVVGSVAIADADRATLARMMVGREVVMRVPREHLEPGRPVLQVSDLHLQDGNGRARLDSLSFVVREHEVLGVAGVDGNGQSELVAVLTGLLRPTSGQVWMDSAHLTTLTPTEFARRSGAVIPEDRHRSGLALDMTVLENLLMKQVGTRPFSRWGFITSAIGRQHSRRLILDYDIRTPGLGVRAGQLSGGNQQKLVLARELSRRPRLLIAAQPTRGLDVGATEFVHRRILEHRAKGGATLLVSTELDEILALSDRIAVIVNGRFLGMSDAADVDVGRLGLMMTGERMETPVVAG